MSAEAQSKLDGTTRGLGLLLIGMAAFTTWDQWAIWSTKDDYTFGYLVPFFSAYVLWDRWEELRALLTGERADVAAPTSRGVLTLAQLLAFASLALFGLGAAARAIFGTGIGPTLAICFGLAGAALAFAFLSVRGPQDAVATSTSRWRASPRSWSNWSRLRSSCRSACCSTSGVSPRRALSTSSTSAEAWAGSSRPLITQSWLTLRRRSPTSEVVPRPRSNSICSRLP